MAGLDLFLLLTPILMLAVAALLVFAGCGAHLSLPNPTLTLQANPGIPAPNTRITPVDLTWNTDAQTFVYRSTSLNGTYEIVGQDGGAFTDTTVTDGTTYYYHVEAGQAGFSGPVSVTPQPPFVSAFVTLGAPTNTTNLFIGEGFLGMAIRVGSDPIRVYALGRLMVTGNNGVHEVRIADASNNSVVASVLVNMTGGTPDSFVYTALPSPVTLMANAEYYIVSNEQLGGDQWHADTTTLLTTGVAAVTSSVSGTGVAYTKQTAGATFGPLDFLYL